jgi:hypothetical protein
MHTLQQDGHMASVNPKTRVNYEPNSWGGELGGPRESPDRGFESYPAPEEGPKLRIRSETLPTIIVRLGNSISVEPRANRNTLPRLSHSN